MHSLDIEAATLRNRLEINFCTFIGYSAYPRLSQASMDGIPSLRFSQILYDD